MFTPFDDSTPHARLSTETLVYVLAFLRAQSLDKSHAALVKELNKAAGQDQYDYAGQAGQCTGRELVPLVRAKMDIAKLE